MKVQKLGYSPSDTLSRETVQLTPRGGFDNVLINSDFSVNQRNPTNATTKGGATLGTYTNRNYVADCWIMRTTGAGVGTVRGTTQPSSCLSTYRSSAKLEVVANGSDTTGSMGMRQYVVNGETLLHKGFWTVSFWVKTDTPSVTVSLLGGTGANPVVEYENTTSVLVKDWTYVTKTFNIDYKPATTALALEISCPVVPNSVGSTLEISDVKLETGRQPTPFVYRTVLDELQECKRMYQRENGNFGFTLVENNNSFLGRFYFPVEMRAVPSVSILNGSGLIYGPSSGVSAVALETKTHIVNQITPSSFRVKVNNVTEIANCAYMNSWDWEADAGI